LVYELDWRSSIDGGKWGVPHTLDIPLTLDNIEVADGMTGSSSEVMRLSALMRKTLINFARTGNPDHPGLSSWRTYNLYCRFTINFGAEAQLVEDPRGSERRLVEQVPCTQPGT
jgi:para-nitrobenzyl esterase